MPTFAALILIPALLASPPISTDAPRSPPAQRSLRPTALIIAGSSGLGFGIMMFAFMGVWLHRGDSERIAHNDVIHAATGHRRPLTPDEREQLASIDSRGHIDNQNAIGFAIAGAVATIVGAVLLGRGLKLRRDSRLAWSGTPRGTAFAIRF